MKSRVKSTVASALGIELQTPGGRRREDGEVTRGESTVSLTEGDAYTDLEPTVLDWVNDNAPTKQGVRKYFKELFPIAGWLPQYTPRWLLGDVIAGITVGAVVVPQGMAYASLAALPPQFGLYSSFMGVLVYWLFATSKDITIGPVAVMSTITGNVVLRVKDTNPDIPGHVVASALAVIAGCFILFIGLIRCGWIVEFISLAAIAAFMTGSAVNIAVGQVPSLLGITGFSSRDATYKVVINTLKNLGHASRYDAAMGVSALVLLYLLRFACYICFRRWPLKRKLFNLLGTLRVAFVILLFVMISWLVNRDRRKKPEFKILGTVPRGFQNAGVPTITLPIMKTFAAQLPATIIVLWIEHIAIAKAFGRVNHYAINPSQEMVAIGLTNVLGPFLGAYPTTGSFSRTAINSKAGACSPAGGVITALVVLLAVYALPAVFFYIPNASLSAVIIHAVCDLITSPDTVYQFWKVSPFEVFIFLAGVLVTVFSTIEIGIYTTMCVSLALLLFRFAKARGAFLGKVKVHAVLGDKLLPEHGEIGEARLTGRNGPDLAARNVFLPVDHGDGSNPEIQVENPYPGIFIYRFSDGFNYPNASHYLDHLLEVIYRSTRPGKVSGIGQGSDFTWSEARLPRVDASLQQGFPPLEAVILDFSAVANVDITAIQQLIDTRNQLDRWAAPETPEWHIACINNKWTRRALVHAGFGYPTPDSPHYHRWKPVFSVADIGGKDSAATAAQLGEIEKDRQRRVRPQIMSKESSIAGKGSILSKSGGPHIRLSSIDEETPRPNMNISVKTTINSEETRVAGDAGRPNAHHGPSEAEGNSRLADDVEKQLRQSTAYGASSSILAKPLPKVTLIHGLDKPLFHVVEGVSRPLFHVGLSSALQSAIHNIELKKEQRKAISNRSDET